MTKSDNNKETDLQKFPSFNLMAAHTDKEISISEKELKAQKFRSLQAGFPIHFTNDMFSLGTTR